MSKKDLIYDLDADEKLHKKIRKALEAYHKKTGLKVIKVDWVVSQGFVSDGRVLPPVFGLFRTTTHEDMMP